MISSERMFGTRPTSGTFHEVEKATVRIFNDYGEEVFRAGQWVPAGTYRRVESSTIVTLDVAGVLPPSFDGKRAEYCRVERPWVNTPKTHNQEATL